MLNPHIPHIEIMRELLLRREVPADLSALCGDDVLVRDEMIHYEDNLIPIEDRLLSQLFHLPDRKRRRNIIPVDQIDTRLDQLPRQDLIETCMRRQNLLAHRHSHIKLPSQFMQSSSDTFPLPADRKRNPVFAGASDRTAPQFSKAPELFPVFPSAPAFCSPLLQDKRQGSRSERVLYLRGKASKRDAKSDPRSECIYFSIIPRRTIPC